ncbi:MAG: glycosyltransferase family 2 protein [Patescibacteria group bacterium]|nr:glycosyltransferase family 2 protein [Patescibacteria group bacterium]
MSIGVLISSHARPHTLRPQLAAIDAQTVKPSEIVIFHDHAPGVQPDTEAMRGRRVVATNWQSGVWNRFAFCLWGFSAEFICVFDDDTIPAPRFLEHLWTQWHERPALYGVNGVIFPTGQRNPREYCGRELVQGETECDIVGHAWFFHRILLETAATLERCPGVSTAGEDYHLAFAAQTIGSPVLTPVNALPTTLGSTRPDLGTDDKALYRQPGEEEKKQRVHEFYVAQGWKTLYHRARECNSRTHSLTT